MANFSEHISQTKNNLEFLEAINSNVNKNWDWQVTVCFYSALHLMNAHIVDKMQKNYLSHTQVSEVLNPFSTLSLAKLDEETYLSYNKLSQLSRRSRYLLNEGFTKRGIVEIQPGCITYDKHFKKAIHHLDKLLIYVSKNYNIEFKKIKINCIELKGLEFKHFEIV